MSLNGMIEKMLYIYPMEDYSAIKNKDIIKSEEKWMELENVILSEVIQFQKVWILVIKYRITRVQSIDPKMLSNKECPRENS